MFCRSRTFCAIVYALKCGNMLRYSKGHLMCSRDNGMEPTLRITWSVEVVFLRCLAPVRYTWNFGLKQFSNRIRRRTPAKQSARIKMAYPLCATFGVVYSYIEKKIKVLYIDDWSEYRERYVRNGIYVYHMCGAASFVWVFFSSPENKCRKINVGDVSVIKARWR